MLQDPVHVSSTDPPDMRPLRAAHACTNTKTPYSAFPLVTGVFDTLAQCAPPGRIRTCAHGSGEHAQDACKYAADLRKRPLKIE